MWNVSKVALCHPEAGGPRIPWQSFLSPVVFEGPPPCKRLPKFEVSAITLRAPGRLGSRIERLASGELGIKEWILLVVTYSAFGV